MAYPKYQLKGLVYDSKVFSLKNIIFTLMETLILVITCHRLKNNTK